MQEVSVLFAELRSLLDPIWDDDKRKNRYGFSTKEEEEIREFIMESIRLIKKEVIIGEK